MKDIIKKFSIPTILQKGRAHFLKIVSRGFSILPVAWNARLISVAFWTYAAVAAVFLDLLLYAEHSNGVHGGDKFVIISAGQSFTEITTSLNYAGLVDRPFKFKLLARLSGKDKRVKVGEYLLSPGMTPNRLLDILVDGKVYLHRLTIPEGYTMFQIADAVQQAGVSRAVDFLRAAKDRDLMKKTGIEGAGFEGYLFPDTYYFPAGHAPEKIIAVMTKRFWSVFSPQWREQAARLGLPVHQIVILASIIEKETGVESERPLVSSVFHNRLKRGMRLESDPTVIYAIKNFDGNLTRNHLSTPTPYNTYQIKGLPVGPIASPGAAALKAALYPADTDFLYFVSKNDKTHQFSKTIEDHNLAVKKYQLRCVCSKSKCRDR